MTHTELDYPIGTPGQAWGEAERAQWLSVQSVQRSYQSHVLDRLTGIDASLEIIQYGTLSTDPERYPLMAAQPKSFDASKPTALITGGVHGYETSGVQGAIRFLTSKAMDYVDHYNIVVAPCISPWAYETINRWNAFALDPNRLFIDNSPCQESELLMAFVASVPFKIDVHIDLHETTDTDNTEFRPALAARDNVFHPFWEIPDGFYLVGDTENPCHDFQQHIIGEVAKVTHIAPSDKSGRIIGAAITQPGVINYATSKLGLCTGFTQAKFNSTTEVYPDSPRVDDENCIVAQVTAVCAGLDYVLSKV